jgi:iron complex outermembrane receptor protein
MKNNKTVTAEQLALGLVFSVGMSGGAAAQTADTSNIALEEVLVTAQKKEETLQDASLSVVAFSADRLQRLGVHQAHEVGEYTPNLSIHKNAGNTASAAYYIRGIGQGDPGLAIESSVGLYLDGVYIGQGAASAFDLVDMERIEVLRGPQGTLYGRNTTGGAINVISRKPTGELGFEQTVSVGNRGYWRSLSRLNLPSYNGVSTQLSYLRSEHDGYIKNAFPGGEQPGERSNEAYRIALNWQASDNLSIDYAYDYSSIDGMENAFQLTFVSPVHVGVGGSQYSDALNNASEDRLSQFALDQLDERNTEVQGHTLVVNWELGDVTVKSITAFREFDERSRGTDLDGGAYVSRGDASTFFAPLPPGTPVSLFTATLDHWQEQWSQEFQLLGSAFDGQIEYVAGLYYFDEEGFESNPQAFAFPSLFVGGAFGQTTQLGAPLFNYDVDNESVAAYGELTWIPAAFDRKLELTLGARYTRDERASSVRHTNLQRLGLEQLQGSDSWSNVNPSFTLNYHFSDDVSVYARVASAYKSGGFNPRTIDPDLFTQPFDEEDVLSYELGLKSEWLDRRLRLNAAAFYTDFEDMQVSQFRAGQLGATSVTVNAGEATIAGVEIDLQAVLAEGLFLNVSYGYLDSDIDEYLFTNSQGITADLADEASMSLAPENSASIGLEYRFAETAVGAPVLSVDWSYKDEFHFTSISTAANGAHETIKADDYSLLNARFMWDDLPLGEGRGRILLWGKNLTDEEYRVAGIDFGGLGFAGNVYGEPKSYGIDLIYEFN